MKKRLLLASAVALLVVGLSGRANAAIITISFDQSVAGTAGGTLGYAGGAAPLTGSGISFDNISVDLDTTVGNPDYTFDCVGCLLDFTTGGNLIASSNLWVWGGGGSFTLTGSIYDGATLVTSGALLTGTATLATGAQATNPGSITLNVLGPDTKDAAFLAYIVTVLGLTGIDPTSFHYANTDITTTTCAPDGSFAFSCAGNNADLDNTGTFTPNDTVPEPGSMLLLGGGLLGLATVSRRRFSRSRV